MPSQINYYAGIGSRKTPVNIQSLMRTYASRLENLGFILRSGGATGSDKAFESGVEKNKNKQIFYANDDIPSWCYTLAENYLPQGYSGFSSWRYWVQKLIARNMMQILGPTSDEPVRFVACWVPTDDYTSNASGGTGYAIRCALDYKIKVFNFFLEKDLKEFEEIVEFLEK